MNKNFLHLICLYITVNIPSIYYRRSEVPQRYHIFKAFVSLLYLLVLSCVLLTIHEVLHLVTSSSNVCR
jgi:hypothetical protein